MDPENYIQNPKTGRLIKKNGKVHKRLIKEGILEKIKRLDQVEIKEGDNVAEETEKLQKSIPPFKKVVKVKNKLCVRDRQSDEYFLNIINDLLDDRLPPMTPKLTRQRGRYRIKEEESEDEYSDELDDC